MPRRYYRRRTTVVKPKKKWASNIVIRNYVIDDSNPAPVITLVTNSAQTGTPTPVIVKAGNFKVNADIGVTTSGSTVNYTTQLMAVVLYVPEGIGISNNAALGSLVAAHPEYILAWRQFDSSTPSTGSPSYLREVTFSSRLKRNLNSGDSIVFGVLSTNSGVTITRIVTSVTAQYWTCAN